MSVSLTAPADEKTGYWRDNPTRYLVVEIDDETGGVKPAIKNRGQPHRLDLHEVQAFATRRLQERLGQ